MIAYADKYKIYDHPVGEYEVLNELNDLSSRSNDNCLYHTRFLFEMDSTPLEKQQEYAQNNIDKICRVTFSGGKSLHMIIEFDKQDESVCKEHYRDIWNYLNEMYFDGLADKQCSNPARLTRRPGAFRVDKQQFQKKLYESNTTKFKISRRLRCHLQMLATERYFLAPKFDVEISRRHDGKCETDTTIKKYLNTPYPHLTGNGTSSSELYQSICKCIANGDTTTLEKVLSKARSERWTEGELEHQIKSARKYLENCT